MAAQDRLRARTTQDLRQHITRIEDEYDLNRSQAERAALKAGIHALGYDTPHEEPPENHAERLLYYVKRVGAILGVAGLTTVGYGIFGDQLFRIWGFGLLLAGFILIATEAFLREYTTPNEPTTPSLTVEEVLRK